MTATDLEKLEQTAERTATQARDARQRVDEQHAAEQADREKATKAWALERCREFDPKALRQDVRAAREHLTEQLRTDPIGQALIGYLTAIMRERELRIEAPGLAAEAGVDHSTLGLPDRSNESAGEPWRDADGGPIADLTNLAAAVLGREALAMATQAVQDETEQRYESLTAATANFTEPPALTPEEAGQRDREQQHKAYLAELAANGVTGPLSVPFEQMTAEHRKSLGYPSTNRTDAPGTGYAEQG